MTLVYLALMLVYLDFSIWYSAQMHNVWHEEKRKFRGFLAWLWGRM